MDDVQPPTTTFEPAVCFLTSVPLPEGKQLFYWRWVQSACPGHGTLILQNIQLNDQPPTVPKDNEGIVAFNAIDPVITEQDGIDYKWHANTVIEMRRLPRNMPPFIKLQALLCGFNAYIHPNEERYMQSVERLCDKIVLQIRNTPYPEHVCRCIAELATKCGVLIYPVAVDQSREPTEQITAYVIMEII